MNTAILIILILALLYAYRNNDKTSIIIQNQFEIEKLLKQILNKQNKK